MAIVSPQQLWAPWRLPYIVSTKEASTDGCFLCRYRDQDADAENLVVTRTAHSITVLNRFPYNNGHLLIAPLKHKGSLDELKDEELATIPLGRYAEGRDMAGTIMWLSSDAGSYMTGGLLNLNGGLYFA